jgi:adenine-specific DNA-methyltransferase
MYENLCAIKSVMSDTASIYVHLDDHIGHYVKILMDEIFGEDNFRSDIIWKRATAHSDSEYYGNNVDMIYFYTKSSNATFNQVYQQYDTDTLPETENRCSTPE